MTAHLEKENLKEYGVIVHSVKSTSATIGAMALSSKALLLEKAANEGDKDYITVDHPGFIKEYDRILEAIGSVVHESGIHETEDEILEFEPEG